MEEGYFYKFIKNDYLKDYCKKNKIEETSNIFLCSNINNKKLLFNIIKSNKIDYDEDFHIKQRINNILYYIDITKAYEINENNFISKISNIKHGILQKKCNYAYENIKDNYEELKKKKHQSEKYIGNIIRVKTNRNIYNAYDDSVHKSVDGEDYLIIGKKGKWYYGCYVFKNAEKDSMIVSKKANKKDTIYGYVNLKYVFRLLDFYFSDIIINEKKNVYDIYNKVLKNIKRTPKKIKIDNKENKKDQEIELLNITINIKKNNNICEKNKHKITNYKGIIKLITKTSDIIIREVPIFYCENCKKYIMLEYDYNLLLKHGQPFCKVINEYIKNNSNNKYFYMNEESELYAYGYNVSQTKGLTVEQRRKILTLLVDNNLMSKSKIMNHLSYLINSRQGMNNFRYATSKWSDDRTFISNYRKNNLSAYKITTIKRKEYY